MSVTVDLADLPGVAAGRGPEAYLLTMGATHPRAVSVSVRWEGAVAVVGLGDRTADNLAARPAVTLLWPTSVADPSRSLIVDGQATVPGDGTARITPATAILHVNRHTS